jgi:hypothetical protein
MPPAVVAAVQIGAAVVGAGLAIKGFVDARKAGKQANAERKRQNEIRQGQAQVQRRAQVRKMITERRMANAQLEQSGVFSGAGQGSSAIAGATGSLATQAAVNVNQFNSQVLLNNMFNISQNRLGQAITDGNTAQALGSLGSGIFNMAGGFNQAKNFKTVFGGSGGGAVPRVPGSQHPGAPG